MTVLRLFVVALLAAVVLAGCNPPGTGNGNNNNPGGGTTDPVVAHWVLSSVTTPAGSSETPLTAGISQDLVFNADKSLIDGIDMTAAWAGSASVGMAVGTWTSAGAGAGTYSFTAYPSGGNGSSAVTGTATLGGSTLTIAGISGPSVGGYTFTFIKSSSSVSSSDPLKGSWILNTVKDSLNNTSTAAAAGLAEIASFEGDSSFLFGQEAATSATMCGVGVWTPGAPGSYTFTAYPSAGTSTASGSATLGGSVLTVPNINTGLANDPYTFTFVKNSAILSSSDPGLGTWALTSVTDKNSSTQTALAAGLQEVLILQADGTLLFGLQGANATWGNQSQSGVGFWNPGSPGSYTFTAYTSGSSSASTGSFTVAGSILTVSGVGSGGNAPYTLTFTKM